MKNNRTLIALVIALMVVNIALLGFMWYSHYQRRSHDMPQQADAFLARELRLTPQQQVQYAGMRKQHFLLTRKLNEENRLLRDSFFNEVKTTYLDRKKVSALEAKITDNQRGIDSATFYHFRQFRAILSAEQQARFDKILNDVLHMMAHPGPRRDIRDGGRGPGGPPPGPDGQDPPPGGPQGPPPGN